MTNNPLPNRNRKITHAAGFGITTIMPGAGDYIARRARRERVENRVMLLLFVVGVIALFNVLSRGYGHGPENRVEWKDKTYLQGRR